eukprot:scaffold7338_cov107-Cylindrotheca_fusiformis.AAC.3
MMNNIEHPDARNETALVLMMLLHKYMKVETRTIGLSLMARELDDLSHQWSRTSDGKSDAEISTCFGK